VSLETTLDTTLTARSLTPGKFADPDLTARGEPRAAVGLERLETLWFNTGTLCNIACLNCYIESSPSNDRLVYLRLEDVRPFLDEIRDRRLGTREIGFTGGEPFMNPAFLDILALTLERGPEVLVLTNAMQPMQRPKVKQRLLALREEHGQRLRIRVSLDHYTRELHEAERGPRSFLKTLAGLDWLSANGFHIAIAGRTCWHELESEERDGYRRLIDAHGWRIDADDPKALMLLPEMDGSHEVPEISTACWSLLGKRPEDQMCATSRMVVKRSGEAKASVVPCTLLPYERAFDMGLSLAEAARVDGGMFSRGKVKLCHPNCAKFCVLGGGSCS
jgi:uncharacterized Fe-S cluster-containing radical SAM superfamily protein